MRQAAPIQPHTLSTFPHLWWQLLVQRSLPPPGLVELGLNFLNNQTHVLYDMCTEPRSMYHDGAGWIRILLRPYWRLFQIVYLEFFRPSESHLPVTFTTFSSRIKQPQYSHHSLHLTLHCGPQVCVKVEEKESSPPQPQTHDRIQWRAINIHDKSHVRCPSLHVALRHLAWRTLSYFESSLTWQ